MNNFIAQLKHLLSHNRTAVVLDLLPTVFRQKEEAFNVAVLLRARYSKVREDQLGNLLTEEEAASARLSEYKTQNRATGGPGAQKRRAAAAAEPIGLMFTKFVLGCNNNANREIDKQDASQLVPPKARDTLEQVNNYINYSINQPPPI